jgi:hypothetical protein
LTVSGKTDDTDEEEPDTPTLTAKAVLDFKRKADMLAEMGVDMDPIMERSLRFDRALTEIVAPYRDISEDICKEIKQ